MKKLLFSSMIFCFFILSAGDVFACSCLTINKSTEEAVKEAFQNSASIFLAKAVSVKKELKKIRGTKDGYVSDRNVIILKVEKSWKNKTAKRVKIYTFLNSAACGFPFKTGGRYLVYVSENDGEHWTGLCDRTALFTAENEDTKFLDLIEKNSLNKINK